MAANSTISYSAAGVLRRLLRLSRSYIPWYLALCALSLASALVSLGPTQAYREIANAATGGRAALLANGLEVGLAALAVNFALNWTRTYFSAKLDYASTLTLQTHVIERLTKAQMREYERFHTADLISRVTDSASSAQAGLNANSLSILGNAAQVAATIVYLALLNLPLTIGVIVISGFIPLLIAPLSRFARRTYGERWQAQADSSAQAQDAVQGAEVVRAYLLRDELVKRFMLTYARIVSLTKKTAWFESIMNGSQYIVYYRRSHVRVWLWWISSRCTRAQHRWACCVSLLV